MTTEQRIREAVARYTGWESDDFQLDIVQDPNNSYIYACRVSRVPEGLDFDFLFNVSEADSARVRGEEDPDVIEEVTFTTWPPTASGKGPTTFIFHWSE